MANVVAFVANDSIIHYLYSFVASLKRWMPNQRAIMIEYDDNCRVARELAKANGIEVVSGSLVHPLVSRVTGLIPDSAPGHFRKLHAFALQEDVVILIDVDVVLLRDISMYFVYFQNNNVELLFSERTTDWVYNESGLSMFTKSRLFSTGVITFSPRVLNLALIFETIKANNEEYNSVRHPGVHDQPLLNYVIDKNSLRAKSIDECDPSMSGANYYLDAEMQVKWEKNLPRVFKNGREVSLLHFAGLKDTQKAFRYREIWQFYKNRQ